MPWHFQLNSPALDDPVDIYAEGREYVNDRQAKDAWEAAMRASIPDAGASRCKSPADPDGPARFVVFLAFNAAAWSTLAPLLAGGMPWEPDEGFVRYLVNKRLASAVRGEASFVHRGRPA